MGRRQNNLYLLKFEAIGCNYILVIVAAKSKIDVWNSWLGHPSLVKLQLQNNELQIPNSSSSSSHCDIFHLTKQKCLPYISHNNISGAPFDLIHIYIWCPFHVSTLEG